MARRCNWRDFTPTLEAARHWIDNCLIEDGSIFSPTERIWTVENIEKFKSAFVDHPDVSSDDFITKLKRQLKDCSSNVIKLASEMLWILYLFPSPNNMGPDSKRDQIVAVWNEAGANNLQTGFLSDEILTGIGSCGTAYNTGRWRELTFLIHLTSDIKAQNDRSKTINDYGNFLDWIANVQQDGTRQFRQILRYFTFPDCVERMSSNNDREEILKKMRNISQREVRRMNDKELDAALMEVRQQYEAQYPNSIIDFYEPPLQSMWQSTSSPPITPSPFLGDYTVDNMITEGVFLEKTDLERIKQRLSAKKNLILQGAPGVGKTFIAKKLAYLLMGEKTDDRIVSVQFHPSYSYEDFVRGYRPTNEAGKFELIDGSFWKLCDKARQNTDKKFVILIDEINRGNLSQIFGELFMLLEADKRGEKVSPLYSLHNSEMFFIPENVYLIGTMNIADRSLALVDYALRRRFAFITLEPQFESNGFAEHLANQGADAAMIAKIRRKMATLNDYISNDSQLSDAFRIGHSFFCQKPSNRYSDDWFKEIVETEIIPLLEEYWHDNRSQFDAAVAELRQ